MATAASVDGYSSSGAVVSRDGAKLNIETHAPLVILADVGVLAAAPKEMTAAGYADLAAKIPAGAEWMIADLFGTEPIIPAAWNVFMNDLDAMLADPEGVAAGKPEAIASLFAGLTLSGIAMLGSQVEPSGVVHRTPVQPRARHDAPSLQRQVPVARFPGGDRYAHDVRLLRRVLQDGSLDARCRRLRGRMASLEAEQRRALDLFRDFPVPELGYTEITKKWNDAETVRVQLTRVKENWPAFKARLQAQCYPFEKMRALFAAAGAPTDPSQIGVSREQLRSMVDFTQLLRWRINLLDLAKRARIYDELVARVFGKGGAWEIA